MRGQPASVSGGKGSSTPSELASVAGERPQPEVSETAFPRIPQAEASEAGCWLRVGPQGVNPGAAIAWERGEAPYGPKRLTGYAHSGLTEGWALTSAASGANARRISRRG